MVCLQLSYKQLNEVTTCYITVTDRLKVAVKWPWHPTYAICYLAVSQKLLQQYAINLYIHIR